MRYQVLLFPLFVCLMNMVNESSAYKRETLKNFAAKYDFPSPFVYKKGKIIIQNEDVRMTFMKNSRKLYFNDLLIWLNAPVVKEKGKWCVTATDIEKIINPLMMLDGKRNKKGSVKLVVLDPGHGGKDPGAIGLNGVYEKKVALDIAKRVKEKLRREGVRVKMTRERDIFLSLPLRTYKAEKWHADLFVSIHANSAHTTRAKGIETYIMPAPGFPSTEGNNNAKAFPGNNHDVANFLLAYQIHKDVLTYSKRADRGIKLARFDVLRSAPCPAVLVECGFVSNEEDEKKLMTEAYREDVATGIAQGVMSYISKSKRR
jgi:N-acetylmuramoyl-L-alanine amidase